MSQSPRCLTTRLPGLGTDAPFWRLPLTDFAAAELARVLTLDDPADRETWTAELMAVEPALALWTACRAGGGQAPRYVVDLAGWLARNALDVLTWPATASGLSRSTRDMRPRWRELSASAIAVANLAADQAEDDEDAAGTFLFGLLHNAPDWLRSCGPKIAVAKGEHGCLPRWLVELLRQRSRRPRSETVQRVVRAGKAWRESDRRGPRIGSVDLGDVSLARKRWQATEGYAAGGVALLPQFVNKLSRLKRLEDQFEQTLEREKLQSLGELAYGASHEINNPLANISTRAQTMLYDEQDPERRRTLAIINTQAFRANEMIADMMLFARPPKPVYDHVDVTVIVDTVLHELGDDALRQGTELAREDELDELYIWGDATQLAMALRAVCLNALEALAAEGRVEVAVEEVAGELDTGARISVHDTGPGISDEARRHLFDPFYSGREAGRGLGLGLSKCWRVVTAHGGRIDVTSHAGEGTTFALYLPADARSASGVRDPAQTVDGSSEAT